MTTQISNWTKSDENCSCNRALCFSMKIAAVTSFIMLISRLFQLILTFYSYIDDQWVKVYTHWHFEIKFHLNIVLTVFSTVISNRRWWGRTLSFSAKHSEVNGYSNIKFEQNRMKTAAATECYVFPWRSWVWRHWLC